MVTGGGRSVICEAMGGALILVALKTCIMSECRGFTRGRFAARLKFWLTESHQL